MKHVEKCSHHAMPCKSIKIDTIIRIVSAVHNVEIHSQADHSIPNQIINFNVKIAIIHLHRRRLFFSMKLIKRFFSRLSVVACVIKRFPRVPKQNVFRIDIIIVNVFGKTMNLFTSFSRSLSLCSSVVLNVMQRFPMGIISSIC